MTHKKFLFQYLIEIKRVMIIRVKNEYESPKIIKFKLLEVKKRRKSARRIKKEM